jgi:bifunctional non-homologous end joining protein LigD
MSLSLYKKKRSFDETPEPGAKLKSSKRGALKFVVQKHAASHLHYDFRLEMEGVLKSWAVPKGPSLNPEDKRLAMMVEDHPYDYKDFEGIIPEGNYGAGTVIVWDEGTYEAMGHEDEPVKQQEKALLAEWHKGDLKIVLHGKKLKGAFALVQMKGRGENAWLLIKKKDEHATAKDITKDDKSAKSGRRLEEIAKDKKAKQWESNRTKKPSPALGDKKPKRVKKKSLG